MDGMKISGDNYYENNNLQDLWITGESLTSDDVYFIKDETTIFPTHKDFGFVYISENELPEVFRNMYNQIIVELEDTSKIQETKSNIENSMKTTVAVTDRETSF